MSLDPVLLARSWPERRPVVLASAALGLVAVAVAAAVGDPAAIAGLYVLPVILVALELGLGGGVAAAALAIALLVAGDAPGVVPSAIAVMAAGGVAGRFSDRMRATHAREQRLLDSGLALTAAAAYERLPAEVGAAALRTPRAIGVAVELAGAPTHVAGRTGGRVATTEIVARGATIGRIEVTHKKDLEAGDRAAIDLLALQAGLAADNHRLLVQERQAVALGAELRSARDDLLEQRSGLGRVLDAAEDDRRRVADTLHEELAQALAAVLLGLRMLGRQPPSSAEASLRELHGQILGVLDNVRSMATSLRPSTLAQLGLVPALEALSNERTRFSIEADGVVEPLPEPLRTGTYRLVEHALAAAPPDEPAVLRLTGSRNRLDVMLDVAIERSSEPVAAARAQAALLGGSLRAEPLAAGGTRMRIRLPLAQEVAEREPVARTTV